ncbi:cation:proton antiporter [Nocardia huaxiensis]|uniref:Cation:proton antiporter n=1 Tax=Nocardia huaxiensis TaxID=2755382 RepID=A0A7D6VCK6_9NOCA|nr:cation:proton antiporter [Nocardia huaxiensis]QLY29657.1 cation:proton antiporter [Nocardia huaxiensis]UFS96769.1 cation:proton antiporter [Nocardia huaxiensis]
MIGILTGTMIVIAVWSLMSKQLSRHWIPAPLVMIVLGMLCGWISDDALVAALGTKGAQQAAELVLALFLFVDAVEIRRGILGPMPGIVARLLLIALPLSLLAAWGLGAALLPGLSWPVLLMIAALAIPTDLVPVSTLVRDRRFPVRVRQVLNAESGYNDGFVAPVFVFAVHAAHSSAGDAPPLDALGQFLPALAISALIGIPLGAAAGYLMLRAWTHDWTGERAVRLGILTIPVIAYALATTFGGNAFVAAFIAGITFHMTRGRLPRRSLELAEEVGEFFALVLWFMVGNVAVGIVAPNWRVLLYALLALTVIRLVPVAISMLGSSFGRVDRALLGWLGPRGVATIVFALLAYNDLHGDSDGELVLSIAVVVVVGSVALHGLATPWIAHRLAEPASARPG